MKDPHKLQYFFLIKHRSNTGKNLKYTDLVGNIHSDIPQPTTDFAFSP